MHPETRRKKTLTSTDRTLLTPHEITLTTMRVQGSTVGGQGRKRRKRRRPRRMTIIDSSAWKT